MKKGLVTYGGYILATFLLVAIAVSQRPADQTLDKPSQQKLSASHRLLLLKESTANTAEYVKKGELTLHNDVVFDQEDIVEYFDQDYELLSAYDVFDDIVSSRDNLSAYIGMQFTGSLVSRLTSESPEAAAAQSMANLIELQQIEIAQNQRIIELLEQQSTK